MGTASFLRKLASDKRGTVSIEFTIVLAGMVATIITVGAFIAPTVHAFADHLVDVTTHAQTVLDGLNAAAPPAQP
jgi:uncharacterized protein (UPF0333 family)